jgi:hypothetical protein
MVKKWIQEAFKNHKEGALHKQLGIPKNKKIGKKLLRKIVNTPLHQGKKVRGHRVTRLMKARANASLNAQSRR